MGCSYGGAVGGTNALSREVPPTLFKWRSTATDGAGGEGTAPPAPPPHWTWHLPTTPTTPASGNRRGVPVPPARSPAPLVLQPAAGWRLPGGGRGGAPRC